MAISGKPFWFAALALTFLNTIHGFDINDLGNISASCHSRGRCQTRRGSRLDLSMDWVSVNCFCDEACIDYGDCCLEAKTYDVDKMKTADSKFECVHIETYGSFYMRGKCANNWSSKDIAELCHKASPSNSAYSTDPFLDMPATSLNTSITYKNYYCGLCNNENMEDLEIWQAQISCSVIDNIEKEYLSKNLQYVNGTWGIFVNDSESVEDSFKICDIIPFVKETVVHKIRRCKDYSSTCSPNWKDKHVEDLCHSYTTVVYGFPPEYIDHNETSTEVSPYQSYDSYAYRNYHCAICNFMKDKDLTCHERQFRIAPSARPVSFTVLFDFGVKDHGCPKGEIWNPFSNTCRLVVCLDKNSEFRNGRCLKQFDRIVEQPDLNNTNPDQSDSNITENYLNENSTMKCDKMFINESDFTRGEDGQIKLLTFRRVYKDDEYEIYKEGILVCIPDSYTRLMGWLTLIGLGTSCFFLIVHLVIFFIVPDLRNLSGKNLASMCVALLVAYICFLVASLKESGTNNCPVVASIMYYFFLASFCWMNVMAFDIWRTLSRATSELRLTAGKQWRKFLLYSLYAWITPLISLIIILTIDLLKPSWIDPTYLPELGHRLCWFGQRKAILIYFAAPLALIMVLNLIFFTLAVKMVAPSSHSTNRSCTQTQQIQLKLYLRLALLMGLSWIIGIIAGYVQMEYIWYFFLLLNTFQGLYILLGFTCTKKVKKALEEKRNSLRRSSSSTKRPSKSLCRQMLNYQDSNVSHMSNSSSTNLSTVTNQSSLTSKSSSP